MNPSSLWKNNGKLTITLILVILIIINIIVGAFLFVDIQVLKIPEITAEIDIIEMNSEETIIQTTLNLENPNQFSLTIKDLRVVTKTPEGIEIMNIFIEGGEIAANKNKTYTSIDKIAFEEEIPETLDTKLTGIVGGNFLGFLKKTLPIVLHIKTNLRETVKNISAPIVFIKGDFGEITTQGLNFTTTIEIENTNSFDLNIKTLSIVIETENGSRVGEFDTDGGRIAANSKSIFHGEGKILIVALNAKTLYITLDASAGLSISGVTESLNFSSQAEITIPQIEDIFTPETPTEAYIDADLRISRQGFLSWGFTSYITLEVINPNKIGLRVTDIEFFIFRIDSGEKTLIGNCSVTEAEVDPENSTFIPAEIFLPRTSLFRGQRIFLPDLPDGLLVVVRANATLPGLDQGLWVGVSGYQDLHIFF
jgi:LEA14-like dessication related protein